MLTKHELKGSPKLVDCPVIVHPLAFELDIRFIHPLGNSGWALLGWGLCGNQRRVFDPPAVRGCVINVNSTFR